MTLALVKLRNLLSLYFLYPFFLSSYIPTVLVEGASVRVADSKAREHCLKGYTFLLESEHLVLLFFELDVISVNKFYLSGLMTCFDIM